MSYALITGASSGIGAEIARQLAARGYNLILAARRIDRLEMLAEELRDGGGLDIQVIQSDLNSMEQVANLANFAKKYDVAWLVNNAGFGDMAAFEDADYSKIMSMMQVNMTALTSLTHKLLPQLLARNSEGKDSYIMNLASMASYFPGPGMGVYYASKHYVLAFTEALHFELKGRINVSAVCPGPVKTEFMDVAKPGNRGVFDQGWVPGPEVIAEKAVRKTLKGKTYILFGAMYYIALFFSRLVPRRLMARIMGWIQKNKIEAGHSK